MNWEEELTQAIRQALSHAKIVATPLPQLPLSLYLLSADFPKEPLSAEEMSWALNEPAYWMFCWASGLALAQYILNNPAWVAGKRVLDFGCGSGVVALAAARAGAIEVVACDLDPASLKASTANAQLNGVNLRLCADYFSLRQTFDLILAADVLYDAANRHFLDLFRQRATEVMVADSRIKNLSHDGYALVGEMDSETLPDLNEFDEFRRVRFYRAEGVLPSVDE